MGFRPSAIGGFGGLGAVDYRLARQSVLSELRKGRLARNDVCDAHPELVRAARECGDPTSLTCPVCAETNVVLVSYVFGPKLPAFGRCITSRRELTAFARRAGDFACYVVEVCPECAWNHLTRTFALGRPTKASTRHQPGRA